MTSPAEAQAAHGETPWVGAGIHTVASRAELDRLVDTLEALQVIDPIGDIAVGLAELEYPAGRDHQGLRAVRETGILRQGPAFGVWAHYPWSGSLVHFPSEDDYWALRTFRNRNLITRLEQEQLRHARIAIFGLSVGSRVLDSLVQAAIGDRYVIADFDWLAVSNLNRVATGYQSVGLPKSEIAGRKIAELDPFVHQTHLAGGYDEHADEVLTASPPDVIVEEVDDLTVKARLRRLAATLRVPLVSVGDADDQVSVDIERYDLGAARPFGGRLTAGQVAALTAGQLPADQQLSATVKIMGRDRISARLIESASQRGITLAGFPQLGTTSGAAGALGAVIIRDILLGRSVPSQSGVLNPYRAFATSTAREMRFLRRVAAMRKIRAYRR